MIGVDNLFKLGASDTFKGFLRNTFRQGISEGVEEGLTSLFNNIAEDIVMGENSKFYDLVDAYVQGGLTPEEAKKKAWVDCVEEMLFDAAGGFASGNVSGGMETVIQTGSRNRAARRNLTDSAQELVTEGLQAPEGSKYYQMASDAQKRLDAGKSLSGGQLYRLQSANEQQMLNSDAQTIQKAVAARLTELGETGDIAGISAAIAKQVSTDAAGSALPYQAHYLSEITDRKNRDIRAEISHERFLETSQQKLSNAERRLISESKFGRRVLNELNTQNIRSGDYSADWTGNIGTESLNAAEYGRNLKEAEVTSEETVAAPQSQNRPATAEAKTVKTPEASKSTSKFEQVQAKAKASGKEATIEDYASAYGKQSAAVVAVYELGEGKQDPAKFAEEYEMVYNWGASGISKSFAMNPANQVKNSVLTDAQRLQAYQIGQIAAADSAKALTARNGITGRTASNWKKGVLKGHGVAVSEVEKAFAKHNGKQVKAIRVLRNLAEVTGIDIVLYKSSAGADGFLRGETIDGVDLSDAQGAFAWKNDKLYIDINAGLENAIDFGDVAKYTMLRTFGHEFTHFCEKWNPEEYNSFRQLVFDHMERKGENVHALIEAKQEAGMSYEEASREVVAEAMTDILPETSFAQELAQKHQNLFQKLLEKLKDFLNDIKEYFNGLAGNLDPGAEALKTEVDGTMRYLEDIVKAYDQLAIRAVENYQAAKENVNDQTPTQEMSNEEAFMDSATAVQNQIRPPYSDGSKAFNTFADGLQPEARKTFDLFYGFYQRSRITNTMSVSGKRVKAVNISSLYLMAQDWNAMLAKEPKWAEAARDLAQFLPEDVRKRMNMNADGTLTPSTMEKEFKMPSSLAQRLVDALPYESIDARYQLGDKVITLPEGKARQSVGGEAYRRAILTETRKLYSEGKLRPVGIGTMSKDRWGSLGFLAANGKTGASGDFTTVCPQMMFNRGCWYCYRRAAMEKGVNNKLVAQNVWYTGEILRIKDSDIAALNKNGGLRIQSFGDWMPHFSAMLADVLYDAELRGLQVKIITKEPSMINYIAALREQDVGKNLYFNLSSDYTIERGPAKQAQGGDSLDAVNPERPYMRDQDNSFWWKRAMSVEEAARYREKYTWVNTRIVATDVEEFIRGLKDNRVDVVTGYHGNIRGIERVDSTTGARKIEVEALGDAGMPRFAFNPVTGQWVTEYEGKTATHKRLAQAIADNGLQMEYYTKTCCITGRCASCSGKCGALARDFNVKNATNRDNESVAYWQKQMEYAVEPEFGDMTVEQDRLQYQARSAGYDYSKTFAQQLLDFDRGLFPERDTFVLGGTPDVLRRIGLASLPMTINQRHVSDSLYGTYKGTQQEKLDHTFALQELATLPEKIADPIAIIHDKRDGKAVSPSNVDVLVEMTAASGKQVIAAVQVGGDGHINGLRIDANKVATVHGNKDSITRLIDAINANEAGEVAVFFMNKEKTTKVLKSAGNPIPRGLSNLDGYIHSISDPGSPVNIRITKQTETKQFREWFKGSKVVNPDGTPKEMYHGTSNGGFTVFNTYGGKFGLFGKGSYFTDNPDVADSYTRKGKGQHPEVYGVYLSIKNPLDMDAKADITAWKRAFDDADLDTSYLDSVTTNEDAFRALKENLADDGYVRWEAEDIVTGLIEGMGYDGITHIGGGRYGSKDGPRHRVYIAFEPEQIKSSTENIGTFDGNNPDIRYQKRTNSLSDREVLEYAAMRAEFGNLTDGERDALRIFQQRLDKLRDLQVERERMGSLWHDQQFGGGDRSEATKTLNRMHILDSQIERAMSEVLSIEDKKVLQRVLKKARGVIMDEERSNHHATVQRIRDSRKEADLRHKIRNLKGRLERSLLSPTEGQYVPAGLAKSMIEVCNLVADDTDLYKNDGSLNKAQQRRETTKLKLYELAAEYEKLKSTDIGYGGEFDETVYAYLANIRDEYAGKDIKDMNLDELRDLYEQLRGIVETLQDAKKLIGYGDAEGVFEIAGAIGLEQKNIAANGKRGSVKKATDSVVNLSLSPIRNVERMSGYQKNSYLVRLFHDFEKGIRNKNLFVMNAYKLFEELSSKDAYEDAVYKPAKTYTDDIGRKFGISKMQMMQAVLSWERETANDYSHIQRGGLRFADLKLLSKGQIRDALSSENSHLIPTAADLVSEFADILKNDKWCQDYMNAARSFFNGMAKDAINETMLTLKHRIVAKDKSYIPFEVDQNQVVKEISAGNDIQQTITAYGMLKDTVSHAPQALIISGLNNILDRHIEQVGTVHGLAIPVRNFNKVWNCKTSPAGPMVKDVIQSNWGVDGSKHIEQAVQDIQGRRQNSQSALYRTIKSNYISATFALNLSVVTKQVGSLFSAMSMLDKVDPVSMVANLFSTMANYKTISKEIDKYTASAWMRRQGVSDAELNTLMTEARRSKLGRLFAKAPAVARPSAWISAMDAAVAMSLWKYAKQYTKKRTKLSGEALLKATAEFYDDLIENTQSMTDVLHRPEIQKRNDVISESLGMFKTDLYQMAGQLQVAAGRFAADKSKENKKFLAKTAYSVVMGTMWAQLMTALFAALRYRIDDYRDDEDKDITMESWMEEFLSGLVRDLVGYIIPLCGSEAMDLFEMYRTGETHDIMDNLVISNVNNLVANMMSVAATLKDGEIPNQTQIRKILGSILHTFTKFPAQNILRTMDAIHLHAKDIANGEFLSFEAGANRTAAQHANRIIEAMNAGDMDEAEYLREDAIEDLAVRADKDGEISDSDLKNAEDSLNNAMRKYLRENEPRIQQAAQAYFDGDFLEYDRIKTEIVEEGKFDYLDVNSAIKSEITKLEDAAKGDTEVPEAENQPPRFTAEEYYISLRDGNTKAADTIYDYLYQRELDEGYLRHQAESNVKSALVSQIKGAYLDEDIPRADALKLLEDYTDKGETEVKKWDFEIETGYSWGARARGYYLGDIPESKLVAAVMDIEDKSRADALAYIDFLDLAKGHEDVEISADDAAGYFEYAQPAGISVNVWLDYKSGISGYTQKTDKMDVIDRLPISDDKKDAIYFAEGWAESKLYEAPWH